MINIVVLETDSNEAELLFRLVSRGRHADIPYYESVETYDLENGVVTFIRLDCAPAELWKVAVASNLVIVSARFVYEARSWLHDWHITHRVKDRYRCQTPEEARAFLAKTHQENGAKRRAQALRKVKKRIREWGRKEDDALFAECERERQRLQD